MQVASLLCYCRYCSRLVYLRSQPMSKEEFRLCCLGCSCSGRNAVVFLVFTGLKICMLQFISQTYFCFGIFYVVFFFFPHDCQYFGGYAADAGLCTLYLDTVFLWMLRTDVMVLFVHLSPPAPRTPLNKGRAGITGCSATARRSKLGNAVWSGQRNKENSCQLSSGGLEFDLQCCLPFLSVSSPKQETVRGC